MIDRQHDVLLETLLDSGSYTKLYSYSHLLNGFAIHVTSKKVTSFRENVLISLVNSLNPNGDYNYRHYAQVILP